MATSNDTRVRVDGFSKIIASVDFSDRRRLELGRRPLAGALHGVRHVDDAAQRLGVERVEIEEMPRLRNTT